MEDLAHFIMAAVFICFMAAVSFVVYAFTAVIYASPFLAVLWLFGWLS